MRIYWVAMVAVITVATNQHAFGWNLELGLGTETVSAWGMADKEIKKEQDDLLGRAENVDGTYQDELRKIMFHTLWEGNPHILGFGITIDYDGTSEIKYDKNPFWMNGAWLEIIDDGIVLYEVELDSIAFKKVRKTKGSMNRYTYYSKDIIDLEEHGILLERGKHYVVRIDYGEEYRHQFKPSPESISARAIDVRVVSPRKKHLPMVFLSRAYISRKLGDMVAYERDMLTALHFQPRWPRPRVELMWYYSREKKYRKWFSLARHYYMWLREDKKLGFRHIMIEVWAASGFQLDLLFFRPEDITGIPYALEE